MGTKNVHVFKILPPLGGHLVPLCRLEFARSPLTVDR